MGKLFVFRPSWHADGLRTYQILIDGVLTESINGGQTVRIDLPPGHHDVVAAVDWCRSRPLGVEIAQDEDRHVRVGTLIGWWYFLLIVPVVALLPPYLHPVLFWLRDYPRMPFRRPECLEK